MNYVIIGNSTAAVGCIEQIRKTDRKGKITVISDEPYHTYGRPLISYYLLGRVDAAHMGYRPADFYEKNGVKTLLGVRAEKIDPAAKKVLLQGGKSVSYDKLLVATGSRPFVPPMEGYDTVKEKFTFMTFADALALEQALSPEKDVLIVGAGLTGLKCMEGILARVKSVTVVDLADRLMPSALDEYGAGIIQRQLEGMGVKFYLKNAVARFDGNTAHLKGGETLPFDILVVAAGVRPNVELVKGAGGEVARGIVTDDRQRTSLPDVYAAGDCTESYDITSGTRKILARGGDLRHGGPAQRGRLFRVARAHGGHLRRRGVRGEGRRYIQKAVLQGRHAEWLYPRQRAGPRGHLYLARAQQDAACGGGCGAVEKASRDDGVLRGGAQGKTCKEGVIVWKS